MKALYIIGNGFDMHHGMKTSYWHFSQFLKQNYSEIFDLLERFISYPTDQKDLWSDFEQNLAYLDSEELLSDNSDYLPDISSDDFRDRDWHTFADVMQRIANLLTSDLLEVFREFILKVELPQSAFENKIVINPESYFLNFNYTDSLEILYGIKRQSINYIHECAKDDCEFIILGHGMDPAQFKEESPKPPDDLDEEQLQEWHDEYSDYSYPYSDGKDSIMKYFEKMHKQTSKIIQENNSFFAKLNSVEKIFVFGHSMSDVDIPYFQKIMDSTKKDVKWIISYYEPDDIPSYIATLKKLGINHQNYELIELTSIQLNNGQLNIQF